LKKDIDKIELEQIVKYFPIILSIIYTIGFLIMSLRLAKLGLHLKDFFTLDYIKAGLLFIIYFFPIFLIIKQSNKDQNTKKFLRAVFSILASFFYCLGISTFLHDSTSKESLIIYPWLYFPFVFFIYFLFLVGKDLKFKQFKIIENLPKLIGIIPFSFFILYNFSTQIYSEIKFEFGGGSPYPKKLVIKKDTEKTPEIIDTKVFYENENWIHFEKDNSIISLPKKYIIEQITSAE